MEMESTWYAPDLAEQAHICPELDEALHLLPEPMMIVVTDEKLLVQVMDDWCVVVGWSHCCWEWAWLVEMLPPDQGWTASAFEKYGSVCFTHLFRP
jgi:hypothetical protein